MLIPWRSLVLITFTFLALPLIPAQPVEDPRHTSFLFDGFNGTNLILETDASVIGSKSVLALTNRSHANHSHEFLLGRALYSIPVQMKSNETISSFSTTFVFSIVHPPSDIGGHGLAFVMTPYTSPMGALPAHYMGLLNLTSNGQPYNHLFAVEFDTIMNVDFNDPDGNHVGVDVNNLFSVQTETAGYWNGEEFHELNLRSGRNPETTHVVGTLGYIAPELIQTGKATPSSDVFSFGVLLLEVACGRNPVDSLEDSERMILAEWAWELYTEGRLLEASDPKLAEKGGYDVGEMEKVLKLGLLCSHPEPESRLGMRHVCQILDGEAPIPYGW